MAWNWRLFLEPIEGTPIDGDLTQPRTRWWNHLYLALWGWKMTIVFEVNSSDAAIGYQVGYKPSTGGPAQLKTIVSHDKYFRMKLGREDCRFYAIGPEWREIPLKVVTRTRIDDPVYAAVPLH